MHTPFWQVPKQYLPPPVVLTHFLLTTAARSTSPRTAAADASGYHVLTRCYSGSGAPDLPLHGSGPSSSAPHRFPPWRSLKRCPPHPALELSQPGDTAPRRPADATTTLPGRGGWQGTRRGRKASAGLVLPDCAVQHGQWNQRSFDLAPSTLQNTKQNAPAPALSRAVPSPTPL